MRSLYQILFLITATLWLNSCSSEVSNPVATSTATSSSPLASPIANPAASPTPNSTTKNTVSVSTLTSKSIFKPAPATKKSRPLISAVLGKAAPSYGLIATTNKSLRQQELLSQVNVQAQATPTGRDPFAPLPGTIPEPPLKPLPPLPRLKLPTRPQAIAAPQTIAYVPPQPKLREAETVTLTGTVEIAGKRYAILSVPGDVTSQYVRAGQRIAGDKVLVKSIETYGTPSVVLQQNGIEFTRYIK